MEIKLSDTNCSRRGRNSGGEKGMALAAVVLCVLLFTILGFSVLSMVSAEISLVQDVVNETKAFYLAEAGLELFGAGLGSGQAAASIGETALGCGSYSVDYYPYDANEEPYAISTGTVAGKTRRIKVTVGYLAPPYECAIYASGMDGSPWSLLLRGTGNPVAKTGGEVGGKDKINGNIFVKGDIAMYEESSVNPPIGSNPFELDGDVSATGTVNLYDSATISGDVNEGAAVQDPPDLLNMNYAVNNTHNVAQIFADAGVTKGNLPVGHQLRDVFEKNPADMTSECARTTGDDYFLTLAKGNPKFKEGDWKTAQTPLDTGNNRVYYIDGDLWIHSKSTFGFTVMGGKSTIVTTGDIHLCDNTSYKDGNSILGLVALGKYNEEGELVSGGNIYYGDPTTGTLYLCSAMMFAANNFLYNSMAIDTFEAEPESGFTINGNISALNRVSIERDWYTNVYYDEQKHKDVSEPRPAYYNPATSLWYDSETGTELTSGQLGTLRHYQMIINYDDRVRNRSSQPPGLPRGVGLIFEGLKNWEELP